MKRILQFLAPTGCHAARHAGLHGIRFSPRGGELARVYRDGAEGLPAIAAKYDGAPDGKAQAHKTGQLASRSAAFGPRSRMSSAKSRAGGCA